MSIRANPVEVDLSVATNAELQQLNTASLIDGDLAYVVATNSYWSLRKASTTAVSATVLATANSAGGTQGGRWHFFATVGVTVFGVFGQARKNAHQVGVTADTDITFPNLPTVGTIPFDGLSFTLSAGITYRLQAFLTADTFDEEDGFIQFTWVDAANNDLGSNTWGTVVRGDTDDTLSTNPVCETIVTPVATVLAKVRVLDSSGSCRVLGGAGLTPPNFSWAFAQQIG